MEVHRSQGKDQGQEGPSHGRAGDGPSNSHGSLQAAEPRGHLRGQWLHLHRQGG